MDQRTIINPDPEPSDELLLSSDLTAGVLVFGSKSRNRAVHGDLVALELLPRAKWRGKVTALTEGQGDEKTGEDSQSKPMPTGGTRAGDFHQNLLVSPV